MLKESMLSKNKKYVLGVSGGPDSMALLDLFRKQGYQGVVALVNYHKRVDAYLDYEVVKEYCKSHDIPLAYKEIFSYDEGNFQAQARVLRYDFYKEVASLYQCEAVLLAHHYDDFLETVLMQKKRHQEDGYWGILETSNYQGLTVLRPLLACTKQQLFDYCVHHQIAYRIDSSNLESDYTRNKIRNQELVKYTKEMKEELYNQAMIHNQKQKEIELYCLDWLNQYQTDLSFKTKDFKEVIYKRQLLRMYLCQFENMVLSNRLLEDCLAIIEDEKGNKKINLPLNFHLIREYDTIYVTKLNEKTGFSFVIEEGCFQDFGFFKVTNQGHDRCGVQLNKEDYPLTIRTLQPGDSILLEYGRKKVSRLFIDAKIPRHLRQNWPIVVNASNEIILVPKLAKNKRYLLAKPTWFVVQ